MLRFSLFGMPVRVRASFLVVAALIGYFGVGRIEETVAWIAIVFVSILIHELGHAVTARSFGSRVAIELNGLGGLTRWTAPDGGMTPGKRALIAAAGSATGLAFGGLVWVVAGQFEPFPRLTAFILESLIYVNVFWGLLNWLPIRPLDGGHLLVSLLQKIAPKKADTIARVVFTATAAVALVLAIQFQLIFIAILAGWLLVTEFSMGSRPRSGAGLPTLSYEDEELPVTDVPALSFDEPSGEEPVVEVEEDPEDSPHSPDS